MIPPLILPKFISTPNFPVPYFSACQVTLAMKRNRNVIKNFFIP